VPVHLFGQAANMTALMSIAEKHRLWVLEDCAQAHLARFEGRPVGGFGVAASWSFYPGKNLGAMGDAGAITTDDPSLARRMAMFARHGGLRKGDHEIEGINSRLDGLQAAVLLAKLPHLQRWTARRRALALEYGRLLADVDGLTAPEADPGRDHVWHLYVVRHEGRDALASHLAKRGIQTAINYPVALPFLPAYRRLGHRPEDFPVAHRHQSRILSLPMFAEMSASQVEAVAGALAEFAAIGREATAR
jgi:dTDP-4-amino-4,6-dideoxygalactose transaminase